jgi:hypothetical protein
MKDKRRHPRKRLNLLVTVFLENSELSGALKNVSQEGALLEVDTDLAHYQEIIGQSSSFKIISQEKNTLFQGKIVRSTQNGEKNYIALHLLDRPEWIEFCSGQSN